MRKRDHCRELMKVALLLALPCELAGAQAFYPTSPLKGGSLVIWMVSSSQTSSPDSNPAQRYATYHEQNAGSFGQDASSVGQTASSTGQTAGSLGTSSSNIGQPAGTMGQTAGSFGTASSNIGQTAGSYGQPASAPLGQQPTVPQPGQQNGTPSIDDPLLNTWAETVLRLRHAFPGLHLQVVKLGVDDLTARLAAGTSVGAYPDVLVGTPGAVRGTMLDLHDARVEVLGHDLALHETVISSHLHLSDAVMLRRAPHPEAARAFAFWLAEDDLCPNCSTPHISPAAEGLAALAVSAAETLLNGGDLGSAADPAFAKLVPRAARRLTLSAASQVPLGGVSLRTEVLSGVANERIAAIGLRVKATSATGFGVLYPVVVLRRGTDGKWKVLQVSMDVAPGDGSPVLALTGFTRPVRPEEVKPVTGISQAAPLDGDSRSGTPELWWDDAGDAGLLVVEWQTHAPDGWSDTHLFFVPDSGPRLQVRVTASFAQPTNEYRWRVWSVGTGGMMNLSDWRRLTVFP